MFYQPLFNNDDNSFDLMSELYKVARVNNEDEYITENDYIVFDDSTYEAGGGPRYKPPADIFATGYKIFFRSIRYRLESKGTLEKYKLVGTEKNYKLNFLIDLQNASITSKEDVSKQLLALIKEKEWIPLSGNIKGKPEFTFSPTDNQRTYFNMSSKPVIVEATIKAGVPVYMDKFDRDKNKGDSKPFKGDSIIITYINGLYIFLTPTKFIEKLKVYDIDHKKEINSMKNLEGMHMIEKDVHAVNALVALIHKSASTFEKV